MRREGFKFNPPPGWPKPPDDWQPPAGWTPEPSWPDPPPGWELWIEAGTISSELNEREAENNTSPGHQQEHSTADNERIAQLESEVAALREMLAGVDRDHPAEFIDLDDDRVLQSVGIYQYHHPLENADAYRERMNELGQATAQLVRVGRAIESSDLFTFDNSLAKGRKMTGDLSKLMLRAYNAEADNSIRSLRVGNVQTAKKRLEASRTSIAKLGAMMSMHISDEFHALRIQEIELTADWLMMKQEEKENAREERARLREEKRVELELAEERGRLDKERTHLEIALARIHKSGGDDSDLTERLAKVSDAIEQNDYRAANIRAGYVYVISNRGAFGSNVVKIGLTRRLEPLDRVKELGDASVPFRFDVHALYFSEDAVALEKYLHDHFSDRAVNAVNLRKEFFFATPREVREKLAAQVGNLMEFTEHADATEYLQSVSSWPKSITNSVGVDAPWKR